ncbi:hypothetical protein [Gordonia sp. DT101]|uniref:hypothetical protein n=1 Tax=Gordonia sp. DT101 TaxID=3416545 RepID=UPI003CF351AC
MPLTDVVPLPGGTFRMGSDHDHPEKPIDPADFPGADPAEPVPGSPAFTPTTVPVDLGDRRPYRPTARSAQSDDSAPSHMGFRCVI